MGQRGSQHELDEIVWAPASVRLGSVGLDLRQPSDINALTKLLNARFVDDRTVEERDGHIGTLVQDSSDFAAVGQAATVGSWVYGHGMQLANTNAAAWENAHHPIAGRGAATFRLDGHDVVWTGDRLLTVKEGSSLGSSVYWQRSATATAELSRGLPAFMPLQTDSAPPASVTGNYVETCLTSKYRCYLHTDTGGMLTAWILDRGNGAIVNKSEISGASNNPAECKIISSANTLVALWRDATSNTMYMNYWTGTQWNGATSLSTFIQAFDVAVTPGGFILLMRNNTLLLVTEYVGVKVITANFAALTSLAIPFNVANGSCAIGTAPDGGFAVVFEDGSGVPGLYVGVYSKAAAIQDITKQLSSATGWTSGVAVCSRALKESDGKYRWVTHASRGVTTGVQMNSLSWTGSTLTVGTSVVRHNSTLSSKSFRVGDEVFCWLRSNNAGTHYLIAGGGQYQVCGYADREEAITRTVGGNYGVPHVLADPNDARGATFTWARPYNTGQSYNHGGNVRVGDIDFLPRLCPVQFGHSVYLSGSSVRNFDGVELGDAGFQDYPKTANDVQASGGSLTATGTYYVRVYPVRYNKKGERFQGAAVTYGPIVLTIGNTKDTLTINTMSSTNHSDVVYEVYRTESLGTTFYLEGTVAGSLTASTVSFVLTMADSALRLLEADPHAAGIGALSEVEEWGPLGCSMLAVSGDRLWGAGGQVPSGTVQFSKLREDGEGAGFDDLAGFQVVDTEGQTITSVHAQNDTTVIHEADKLFVIAGTGPDNYGRGAFQIPQIELADGAITHFGSASTQLGSVYWAASGPRLLTNQFKVENIGAPVRPLAETLTISGVRVNKGRQEVVWYTEDGTALLWNYLGENSRWAQWNGLEIAGCSPDALVSTDGRLLIESANAVGDDGLSIPFVWKSGNLRAEQIMSGATLLRSIGIVGTFRGSHVLRFRIFYNGSPLWSDEFIWEPETNTWLTAGEDYETLTPAQIDALGPLDKSGSYATSKRTSRRECRFFQVEASNLGATSKTYTPYELSLELGSEGTLARTMVNTFTTKIGR